MKVQEDNEPFDDINITPMLDLAYVLLIIFIIMTTASVQGIKVNLPQGQQVQPSAGPNPRPRRSPLRKTAGFIWILIRSRLQSWRRACAPSQ